MKVKDNIAFTVLIISVSAMDSESIFMPAVCCIVSLLYLFRRSREYGSL